MGDYFGDCHRIGGAVQWTLTGFATVIFSTSVSLMQRGATHIFGNSAYYRHLPLIDIDVQTIGREVPWYRDWCAHTVYDDYWKALNTEAQLAATSRCRWSSRPPGTTRTRRRCCAPGARCTSAAADQKIYVIPWTHHLPEGSKLGDLDFGPGAYVDLKHEDLRWFDYWLKGIDTGIMAEPPIKLFVMGENVWRYEHEWPLARTRFTPYYLHSQGSANSLGGDGTLTPEPPGSEPPDRYDYDPDNPVPTLGGNNSTWTWMKFAAEPIYPGPIDQRPLERRDDVLVYTSPPLEHDLEVTGPLEMVLYAELVGARHRLHRQAGRRVPGRPGDPPLRRHSARAPPREPRAASSFWSPVKSPSFASRWRPPATCSALATACGVEISSSNFPRFDRNLNTGEDIFTSTRMQVAHQTVLHDQRYPSHLVVPVIPR